MFELEGARVCPYPFDAFWMAGNVFNSRPYLIYILKVPCYWLKIPNFENDSYSFLQLELDKSNFLNHAVALALVE